MDQFNLFTTESQNFVELVICVTVSSFKVVDDFIFFLVTADEVTRDYAYGETDPLVRRCRLIPWIPTDVGEVSSVTSEPPDSYYEVRLLNSSKSLAFRLLDFLDFLDCEFQYAERNCTQ